MLMRRHKRIKPEAELNVTSFMNLMIVLVPVLLMNMVFSQVSVLDLKLPSSDEPSNNIDLNRVTLEVIVEEHGFTVARSVQQQREVVLEIAKNNGEFDFNALSAALQDIKKNPIFRNRRDISLLPSAEIDYQTLIRVMETLRQYPAVVAASLVDAELFPDISLGYAEQGDAS